MKLLTLVEVDVEGAKIVVLKSYRDASRPSDGLSYK
jgi:hypothetical protein